MLTDKHIIYAAHKLLWIQFPHLQGCHSTLLLQLKKFPSVTSVECSGNNLICTCKSLSYYRHVFIFVFFIADQIFFVEERQHWITTAMINGEVHLFDCLFNGTLHLVPSSRLLNSSSHLLDRMAYSCQWCLSSNNKRVTTVGCSASQQHTMQLSEVTLVYWHLMRVVWEHTSSSALSRRN